MVAGIASVFTRPCLAQERTVEAKVADFKPVSAPKYRSSPRSSLDHGSQQMCAIDVVFAEV